MILNKKKYQQVILYLCEQLNGEVRGKKKLAKLLYFADFDFYEKTQKSITGDTYNALPMGPVPASLETITQEMAKKKLISIRQAKGNNGYFPTEVYEGLVKPDAAIFTTEEKQMLDRIVVKYGQLNGKQLGELSHAEAPYVGTKPGEAIPYELAFYRGTDFEEI